MKELAIVEGHIYGALKPIALTYGWMKPQVAPFDVQEGTQTVQPLPVLYYRMVASNDKSAIGPGRRVMTEADYEIGIFHDKNTLGATLETGVTILDILQSIDNLFQNDAIPVANATLGGTIFSVERMSPIRIPERSNGKVYRRDGGI